MYLRFTEVTIDPKKREQAEMIAASIFTAARQQKGFKGVSFCLDSKGEGVFLSLWESKEALEATVSGIRKDAETQATQLARDAAHAARNEPGFIAWYGALTDDSKVAAISFWESENTMTKSESRYLKDALGKLKEIATDDAQPRPFEVVEHEIPAVAAVR